MLNEGIDIKNESLPEEEKKPFYTEKQVGRIITSLGLKDATKVMNNAIIESTKTDNPKNA